jgi:hypothetical protein
VLGDLFSGPIEDADAFFDKVFSGFAQLGQANLQAGLDRLFGGGRAANDNFQPNTTSILDVVGGAVQRGAEAGSQSGTIGGFNLLKGGAARAQAASQWPRSAQRSAASGSVTRRNRRSWEVSAASCRADCWGRSAA